MTTHLSLKGREITAINEHNFIWRQIRSDGTSQHNMTSGTTLNLPGPQFPHRGSRNNKHEEMTGILGISEHAAWVQDGPMRRDGVKTLLQQLPPLPRAAISSIFMLLFCSFGSSPSLARSNPTHAVTTVAAARSLSRSLTRSFIHFFLHLFI